MTNIFHFMTIDISHQHEHCSGQPELERLLASMRIRAYLTRAAKNDRGVRERKKSTAVKHIGRVALTDVCACLILAATMQLIKVTSDNTRVRGLCNSMRVGAPGASRACDENTRGQDFRHAASVRC